MSQLSYLSKSVGPNHQLTNKVEKKVILPDNTKMAIMEDDLEELYGSENSDSQSVSNSVNNNAKESNSPSNTELSSEQIVTDILDNLLNVLLEQDGKNLAHCGMLDNSVIKKNIHKLHKQVFIKRRVTNALTT